MPKKLQPKKAIVVSESESEDEPKFLESTVKLIKLGEAIETQTNNKIASRQNSKQKQIQHKTTTKTDMLQMIKKKMLRIEPNNIGNQ